MKEKSNWIAISKKDKTIYKRNVYRTDLLMINTIFSQEYKSKWIEEKEKVTGKYKAGQTSQEEKRKIVIQDFYLIELEPEILIQFYLKQKVDILIKGAIYE